MTKYVDLHLRAPLQNVEKTRKMAEKSSEIGYSAVGIPLLPKTEPPEIERLRKICKEAGLDFISRVDLAPRNANDLLTNLRRLRRRFEVVSVMCTSKPVARQAAKDRRVDLLSFPVDRTRGVFFDRAQAELASKSSASFEIDVSALLLLEGYLRIRLLLSLRREVTVAKSFRVPVVISSGAADECLLRRPQDYSALTRLFDLDSSLASKALSENPLSIVQRNRVKLSPDFVAPGIRVVRRKDP